MNAACAHQALHTLSREDLVERVIYLESELGLTERAAVDLAHCRALGLTAMQLKVFRVLAKANGRILSRAQLIEAVDSAAEDSHIVVMMVWAIRQKLGADTIRTDVGYGYSITSKGRAIYERLKASS